MTPRARSPANGGWGSSVNAPAPLWTCVRTKTSHEASSSQQQRLQQPGRHGLRGWGANRGKEQHCTLNDLLPARVLRVTRHAASERRAHHAACDLCNTRRRGGHPPLRPAAPPPRPRMSRPAHRRHPPPTTPARPPTPPRAPPPHRRRPRRSSARRARRLQGPRRARRLQGPRRLVGTRPSLPPHPRAPAPRPLPRTGCTTGHRPRLPPRRRSPPPARAGSARGGERERTPGAAGRARRPWEISREWRRRTTRSAESSRLIRSAPSSGSENARSTSKTYAQNARCRSTMARIGPRCRRRTHRPTIQ
jgi:hypothetical protein